MPILDVYVDDETLASLKEAAAEHGRTVEWCAEAAVSEAAIQYKREQDERQSARRAAAEPAKLTPLHIKLLQRGAFGRFIGLSDDMGTHVGEVVALGELERMGFVEPTKEPLPPGPPSMTPSVITEAGRAALREHDPGRPLPPHGSGP
jgi:hypothetical protein